MPKLPLLEEYVSRGAKVVFYGGFSVPQEFSGLAKEHQAVREKAGLFDVSHMARIYIKGNDAIPFVEKLVTNHIANQPANKAIYAFMCNEDGYPIDDLIAYVLNSKTVLLVMNATNSVIDMEWLHAHKEGYDITIENVTLTYLQLALQGPKSEMFLQNVITKMVELSELKFMQYLTTKHKGKPLLISRSGYTGSDGFEIYADQETMLDILLKLLENPEISLCGLGARDTLRFEAALPLHSHEISDHISPIEAGLGFAVKFDKEFIGKPALLKRVQEGTDKKLVGIELIGRGVARAEYEVKDGDKLIGHITTGYILPGTTKALAMAFIDTAYTKLGTKVTVMMRTTPIEAVVRDMIFMTKQYKR
jgi:glycine cleavage system T protein